jgi:hypothetical protein
MQDKGGRGERERNIFHLHYKYYKTNHSAFRSLKGLMKIEQRSLFCRGGAPYCFLSPPSNLLKSLSYIFVVTGKAFLSVLSRSSRGHSIGLPWFLINIALCLVEPFLAISPSLAPGPSLLSHVKAIFQTTVSLFSDALRGSADLFSVGPGSGHPYL